MEDDLLRSVYLCDKVILIGDSQVGKTAIFRAFSEGTGLGEFRKRWVDKSGNSLALTLYDTPYGEITGTPGNTPPILLTGDKSVLLVYSINDIESFLSVRFWLNEVLSKSRGTDPLIGLVGNKLDLESERTVSKRMAKEFADNHLISEDLIFEVSATEGTNLQVMFNTIAVKLNSCSAHSNNTSSGVKIKKTSKSECCQ